jgi:uncharacterized delta-60 repeat protein
MRRRRVLLPIPSTLIAAPCCALLLAGCGADEPRKVESSSKPIPATQPLQVDDAANEGSNLVVDEDGFTYVLVPTDGDEEDTEDDDARPGEGGPADTAPNVAQVVRLTPSGKLDREYGDDGHVDVQFEDGDYVSFTAQRIAASGDEHLVIAGSVSPAPIEDPDEATFDEREAAKVQSLGITRITVDGELDETFGGTGAISFSLVEVGLEEERIEVLALLPDEDGITLSVGRSANAGVATTFLRLLPDGTPDRATWNEGSEDLFDAEQRDAYSPVSLAQAANGDVTYAFRDGAGPLSPIGEPSNYEDAVFAAVPYELDHANRSLRSPSGLSAISVLDDGVILGLHVLNNDEEAENVSLVTRQAADGTIDEEFGAGSLEEADLPTKPDGTAKQLPPDEGVTWLDPFEQVGIGQRIAVDDDGSIYVAGPGRDDSDELRVVKLREDGTVDETWGEDGMVRAEFTIADEYMYRQPHVDGIQLLEDGALLVLVYQDAGPYFGRSVYRITKDGELDGRWGKAGVATVRPTLP